ncbi:hypothetical protein [Agrobacterium vitis]|uniref:Uncharacterized protein n=1 Tax=Agrobacterium vitis TaxID=373 RepID=A0ABW9TFP8_AGRVI|nr:hypothetical protein [Agrobacterium vitis]MUO42997.1 hypothetical protein [Agrobacterium vitis]
MYRIGGWSYGIQPFKVSPAQQTLRSPEIGRDVKLAIGYGVDGQGRPQT